MCGSRRVPAVALLAAWLCAAPAFAEPFAPWGVGRGEFSHAQTACPAVRGRQVSGRTTDVFFLGAIWLYQAYLSPLKGFHCPSTPGCSSFALASARRYGIVRGALMAIDRLFIRENASMGAFLPLIRVKSGEVRFYDPPEHNDLVTPLPFPTEFVERDARW